MLGPFATPAAARPFSRCRYWYCRAPPANRCPWRQRQRVTEGNGMGPTIIIIKMRRLAVDLEMHCNTGSESACCHLVINVTTCSRTALSRARQPLQSKNWALFWGSQHTNRASPRAPMKTHIGLRKTHPWNVDYSPRNNFCHLKLCRLSCMPRTVTPLKMLFLGA